MRLVAAVAELGALGASPSAPTRRHQRPAHATGNARLPGLSGATAAGDCAVRDGLDEVAADVSRLSLFPEGDGADSRRLLREQMTQPRELVLDECLEPAYAHRSQKQRRRLRRRISVRPRHTPCDFRHQMVRHSSSSTGGMRTDTPSSMSRLPLKVLLVATRGWFLPDAPSSFDSFACSIPSERAR